ncbi:MAG: HAD family hydrolase [Nitrososphaerota archaeon]
MGKGYVIAGQRRAGLLGCAVFDLDGTLVEFPHEWIRRAKACTVEKLIDAGFKVPDVPLTRPLSEIMGRMVSLNGPGSEDEIYRIVDSTFREFELRAAMEARVREGAAELLESVRREARVAVATNNSREAALRSLQVAGLSGYVSVVVSRDEVDRMKPDPQMVIKAVRECRSPLNGAVHVGDSYVDVVAARSTGVLSIAVLGGVSNLEELVRHRPHIIARDLNEVRMTLESMMLGRRPLVRSG